MVKTEKSDIIDHFIHLFEYNDWATKLAANSVIVSDKKEERSTELLSHIVSAQTIWLNRILGNNITIDPWQKLLPEECITLSTQITSEWISLLKKFKDIDLAKRTEYKNIKGEKFSNTIKDIITHVINHSTYHRAQIAQLVRQSGGEPAKTDYIVYQRRF